MALGGGGGGAHGHMNVFIDHWLISKEIDCEEVQKMNIVMNMFPPIIIKCHTPLNKSNSIKVEINMSHAMCNMSVQQMIGENIVLNKFNTSVALRNFNHSIYLALYFFTFAC